MNGQNLMSESEEIAMVVAFLICQEYKLWELLGIIYDKELVNVCRWRHGIACRVSRFCWRCWLTVLLLWAVAKPVSPQPNSSKLFSLKLCASEW